MPIVNDFTTTLGVKLKPGAKQEVKSLETGFKDLSTAIKGLVPVIAAVKILDVVNGIDKAVYSMRALGQQMAMPLSQVNAFSQALQGAGVNAQSAINTMRGVRSTLQDVWGYGTDTAYRLGVFASDNKTDEQLMNEVAARIQREKNPIKRARIAAQFGITDPLLVDTMADKEQWEKTKADVKRNKPLSKVDLKAMADAGRALNVLTVHADALKQTLAASVSPSLKNLYESLAHLFNNPKLQDMIEGMGNSFNKLADIMKGAVEALDKYIDKSKDPKKVGERIANAGTALAGVGTAALGKRILFGKATTEVATEATTAAGVGEGAALKAGGLGKWGQLARRVGGKIPYVGGAILGGIEGWDYITGGDDNIFSKGGDLYRKPSEKTFVDLFSHVWDMIIPSFLQKPLHNLVNEGDYEVSAGEANWAEQIHSVGTFNADNVVNPNPQPIRQNNDLSVSIQTFNASPGQTFEDAVDSVRQYPKNLVPQMGTP